MSTLLEKGIALAVVQLLLTVPLEEHIRCAAVLFVSQLVALDNFRTEFLNNKELFALLLASMRLDGKPRYSIFEIFLKISEFEPSFLKHFNDGMFRQLLFYAHE